MRFGLSSLIILFTVSCVFFAVISYGLLAVIVIGVPLARALWELIQFGRELRRR
jgi:hypothetical protein